MKKIFLFIALLTVSAVSFSQTLFVGNWEGSVTTAKKIRLIFHIVQKGDSLSATMDSPDQGVTGIACQNIIADKDSLIVDMTNMGIVYNGKLHGDVINGTWHQAGKNFDIDFKKTNQPTELYRPQTPKPPYSYVSEDVIYYNKDKSIQYGATITMPKGKGPFPAILLITGSGQQNRDEELFGHKPFAVIADYLTKRGYLVMRVDDRMVGQTTGDITNATTADFATDVMQGVNYLETRKEVDKKKIVLMGHSEGGLIAPMVAAKRKDIYAIVLLAGPGVEIPQLMEEQSAAMLENSSPNEETLHQYKKLYRSMENAVLAAKDSIDVKNRLGLVVDAWLKTTAPEIVETVGINDEKTKDEYIRSFVGIYKNSWFYYFLHVDPAVYLEKLSCKVLAINGEKDVQVIAKSNLEGIKASLQKSKSHSYEIKELPGLNHLFQQCVTCTSNEYGVLTETIAPIALQTIGNWLDKNVKEAK